LDANLASVPRETVSSNAEAARRAAAEPGAGAIAGEVAAADYALTATSRTSPATPRASS